MKSLEKYIEEAKLVHGNRHSYNNYIGSNEKIQITCNKHGIFYQRASAHLAGQGCKQCVLDSRTSTIQDFIKKASLIHNNKYDYSKSTYVNSTTPITIICPIHGDFSQLPSSHLYKKGCAKCGGNKQPTTKEFIKKANIIHNNRYNYSKSIYTIKSAPLVITCTVHGDFSQTPNDHLDNHGCPKCGRIGSSKSVVLKNDDFVKRSNLIHNNKYQYIEEYTNGRRKINILCKEHGVFSQVAQSHLRGNGCPRCKVIVSKPHKEISNFLESYSIQHIINDRTIISPYELDVLSNNIAIEYHGEYWHLSKSMLSSNKHKIKADLCDKHGVILIQIFGDEWKHKKDIVKSNILSFFDKNTNIVANNVETIDDKSYQEFAYKNYLFSIEQSDSKYCITNNSTICATISFNIVNNNVHINEYIVANYINVINGFTTFIRFIASKYNPCNIFIIENRRIPFPFRDKLHLVEEIKPKYIYLDKNKKAVNFNETGVYKLFDAGYNKYRVII